MSFGAKERSLGEAAAGQMVVNARNTIWNVKRLLGKKWSDPDVQDELKQLCCRTKQLDGDEIGFEVSFRGEQTTFTPEVIAGMLLNKLKADAEKALESKVSDVVIACPGWWTEAQRRALINAAEIAGLRVQRLIHETTAVALQYGLFKTELPEDTPTHVMFLDVGHSQTAASVVAFTKSKLRVLSQAYDTQLGGRDFDRVLAQHLAADFQKRYKLDVNENARSRLRLQVAVERLKKVLSANPEASINIDSLMNDVDVRAQMKRSEFEALCAPLLDRACAVVSRALEQAHLKPEQLAAVEVVGGAFRIPALQQRFEALLGRPLQKTANAAESVVRGAALAAAMMSVSSRVRDYSVQDAYPYQVAIAWRQQSEMDDLDLSPAGQRALGENRRLDLVRAGQGFPTLLQATLYASETLEVSAFYTDPQPLLPLPPGTPPLLARWRVHILPAESRREIKLRVNINPSGLILLEQANLAETVEILEPEPTPAPAPAAAPDTTTTTTPATTPSSSDSASSSGTAATPGTPPPTGTEGGAESKTPPPSPTQAGPSGEPSSPAAGQPPPLKKKKQTRLTPLDVEVMVMHGLPERRVRELGEEEARLVAQDRLVQETAERRNALEAYILNLRSRLSHELAPYAPAHVRDSLLQELDAAEQWLYGEGEDVSKSQYQERLQVLEAEGNPIVRRYQAYSDLPDALRDLRDAIQRSLQLAQSQGEKYSHIEQDERQKIIQRAQQDEAWAGEQETRLAQADRTHEPPFTASQVQHLNDQEFFFFGVTG